MLHVILHLFLVLIMLEVSHDSFHQVYIFSIANAIFFPTPSSYFSLDSYFTTKEPKVI